MLAINGIWIRTSEVGAQFESLEMGFFVAPLKSLHDKSQKRYTSETFDIHFTVKHMES